MFSKVIQQGSDKRRRLFRPVREAYECREAKQADFFNTLLQRMQDLKTPCGLIGNGGETGSHFLRITHRIGEGDSSPLHAIGRFDPQMKAQAV